MKKNTSKFNQAFSQDGLFRPMMTLAMLACGHLGDRTTVIYGEKHMTKISSLWTALRFW